MTRLTLGFEEKEIGWVVGVYGGVQYDVGYEGQYLNELQREYVVGGLKLGEC